MKHIFYLLITCVCSFCIFVIKFLYGFEGLPIGFFSESLNQIARTIEDLSFPHNFANKLDWIDLSAENSTVSTANGLRPSL